MVGGFESEKGGFRIGLRGSLFLSFLGVGVTLGVTVGVTKVGEILGVSTHYRPFFGTKTPVFGT